MGRVLGNSIQGFEQILQKLSNARRAVETFAAQAGFVVGYRTCGPRGAINLIWGNTGSFESDKTNVLTNQPG
jgi:hypothetical protein